jgi:hypothetical protein
MDVCGRPPVFLLLCLSAPLIPGSAQAGPNVGGDRLMPEAVAQTEQPDGAASPVEALSLSPAARARLQEVVHRRERSPASEEQPAADQSCAHRFERIARGESRCGIGLGEDDRIYLGGIAVGEPIVSWGRPDELFLFPASPGGRYRVVDACGDMCGRALVVDVQHHGLREAFAGRYGPEKDWIGWSPDGAHAALAYEDEGFTWLYVIRASDGASWEVLNEGLVVRPESLRWLDGGRFEVRAVSCRGGLPGCGAARERGATGDLVRVTVTANGPEVDLR